jgi:hypothetical protein
MRNAFVTTDGLKTWGCADALVAANAATSAMHNAECAMLNEWRRIPIAGCRVPDVGCRRMFIFATAGQTRNQRYRTCMTVARCAGDS